MFQSFSVSPILSLKLAFAVALAVSFSVSCCAAPPSPRAVAADLLAVLAGPGAAARVPPAAESARLRACLRFLSRSSPPRRRSDLRGEGRQEGSCGARRRGRGGWDGDVAAGAGHGARAPRRRLRRRPRCHPPRARPHHAPGELSFISFFVARSYIYLREIVKILTLHSSGCVTYNPEINFHNKIYRGNFVRCLMFRGRRGTNANSQEHHMGGVSLTRSRFLP